MGMRIGAIVLVAGLVLMTAQRAVPADTLVHYGQTITVSDDPIDCMFCHDGGIAKRVVNCTTKCDFRTSHVVDKDYPAATAENTFAPQEEVVAQGLRLAKGKVVCVTCHDLRRNTAHHLVITMDNSALCRTCHLK
jgi:hypothetical protein